MRRRRDDCECGSDLPGHCPGRAACPYSSYDPDDDDHDADEIDTPDDFGFAE